MDKNIQIVGFRIGGETFGLPISTVREILPVPPITAVPNAPEHIEGVINLRGQIVPVIDLRKRFGVPAAPHKKNRVVVAESDGRRMGLIVSSASEVLRIPPSEIEECHTALLGELSGITGVAKLNGRLVMLLDLEKILRREEPHDPSEPAVFPEAAPAGRTGWDA